MGPMKIRSKEPLVIEAWDVPRFRGFVACLGLGLNHGNSPLSPKTGDAATPNNLTFGKRRSKNVEVSYNGGTPISYALIEASIVNYPF